MQNLNAIYDPAMTMGRREDFVRPTSPAEAEYKYQQVLVINKTQVQAPVSADLPPNPFLRTILAGVGARLNQATA